MNATRKRWGKDGEGHVLAYHVIQSFKPGEITPQQAHEIGCEFARRLLAERYEVTVSTHLDKSHLHNHIVFNTYKECFTKTIQRGKGKGKLKGFPLCGRCNIQRDCKVRPIQKYMKCLPQETQQYVGLATDEQDRLMRLQEKQISLLEQYACSEAEAWELCRRYGLLSPVYDFTDRNGCWFCPNAKLPELRHLYDHHPDLWREMLALQALPNKATEKFNRELRFSDYDILFHNEDAQLCWFTQ